MHDQSWGSYHHIRLDHKFFEFQIFETTISENTLFETNYLFLKLYNLESINLEYKPWMFIIWKQQTKKLHYLKFIHIG